MAATRSAAFTVLYISNSIALLLQIRPIMHAPMQQQEQQVPTAVDYLCSRQETLKQRAARRLCNNSIAVQELT
jgi:hypothetical protein